MKKTLLFAITATVFSSATFAGTIAEISQATDNETSLKLGHALDNGISFGIEGVYSNNGVTDILGTKKGAGYKETTLGAAWKVAITDNAWVQPQIAYTIPSNTSFKISDDFRPSPSEEISLDKYSVSGEKGNTLKVGLKAGYDFDNGVYVAGRYRYDMRDDNLSLNGLDSAKNTMNIDIDGANSVHRTDLTFGYTMDVVDLSVNWIHKEAEDSFKGSFSEKNSKGKVVEKGSNKIGKTKARQDEFEMKAVLLTAGDVKPYIQYTVKSDVKLDNAKITQDNVFKLGVAYAF
ncbi:oligogalacturonate-specific porin KdgM family protein [Photobacterium makurazakiensis]|uniref:hypothetical protein n=1 Tax=Photobacterium makurazakiensis TaxID=2910234 RepID=UPI003D0C7D2F